jgi:hypothetical protein
LWLHNPLGKPLLMISWHAAWPSSWPICGLRSTRRVLRPALQFLCGLASCLRPLSRMLHGLASALRDFSGCLGRSRSPLYPLPGVFDDSSVVSATCLTSARRAATADSSWSCLRTVSSLLSVRRLLRLSAESDCLLPIARPFARHLLSGRVILRCPAQA